MPDPILPNIETRYLREYLAQLPVGPGSQVVGTDLTTVMGLFNDENAQAIVEALTAEAIQPAIEASYAATPEAQASQINNEGMTPLTTRQQVEFGGRLQAKGRGLSLASSNQTPLIQSIIDGIVNEAVALNDTIGIQIIEIPGGSYVCGDTVYIPPWVKLKAVGTVELDFTSAPSNVIAIRSSNELAPAGTSATNAGNRGAFIDGDGGTFLITGPGTATASVGLDLGNSAVGADAKDYRDTFISNVVVSGFGVGANIRNFDTYLMTMNRVRFRNNGISMRFAGGTVENSGERMLLQNMSFAGGTVGIEHDVDSMDITVLSASVDFVRGVALHAKANARYAKVDFAFVHFEGSSAEGLVKSDKASSLYFRVGVLNSKIIPTTSTTAVPTNARPDGGSMPYISQFRGKMELDVKGLAVSYTYPCHNADYGFWLCDADVELLDFSGLVFNSSIRQLPSPKLVANRNAGFTTGSNGDDSIGVGVAGWTRREFSGTTAILDNTRGFDGSPLSLKITSTIANGFLRIESDPFPVSRRDTVMAQSVLYGGASTGNVRVEQKIKYYRPQNTAAVDIARVIKGTTLVTVETVSPHGLVAGSMVFLEGLVGADGLGQPEYNRKHFLENASRGVTGVTITAGGSGYVSAPTVTISGGGGSGATATAQISGGVVTGVTITNPGTNHISAPTIAFSSGSGTGAAGTGAISVAPNVFTFRLAASVGAPIGVPRFAKEAFAFVGESALIGTSSKVLYDDTDFPGHTGDRLWWCRSRDNPLERIGSVPAGCTVATLEERVSELASGDEVWLGFAGACTY